MLDLVEMIYLAENSDSLMELNYFLSLHHDT